MTASVVRQSVVPNFRKAAGVKNVYRSSAPDNLADYLDSQQQSLLEAERFILFDATLIVDLRSASEVDEAKRTALVKGAPGGEFEEFDGLEEMCRSNARRQLLRVTDSAPTISFFFEYARRNWVSSDKVMQASTENEKRELALEAINGRGLMALVEVILESKLYIANVLKGITLHLEQTVNGKVLVHCSLGKDRAGIVIMLCEAMLGVTDVDIIDDFAKSGCIQSLAERTYNELFQGKIDAVGFSSAPTQTMMLTLEYLRSKYGSITNYLNSVGFDESWQRRYVKVAA